MARFLRTIFMNKPADCDWLRSTALKALTPPPFGSFQLHGNEDSPARIELFASAAPEYNTKPNAIYAVSGESFDLALVK